MTQLMKAPHLRRAKPGSPPVPVTLTTAAHGHGAYINIKTADGLHVSIGSSRRVMLHLLSRLLNELDVSSVAERGIVHGEAIEETFTLITIDDLKEALSDKQKLALLIERFRDSDAGIYEELLADYKTKTDQKYNSSKIEQGVGNTDTPTPLVSYSSQLLTDLQTISPHVQELLTDNGLVYGARTKIAEILQIPNGGSSYKRIKAVAEHLEQQNTRKKAA